MEASQLKRMKELEEENSRLKRMYAELSMINDAMKSVIEKKWAPDEKREIMQALKKHGLSVRQASSAAGLPRSTAGYIKRPRTIDHRSGPSPLWWMAGPSAAERDR